MNTIPSNPSSRQEKPIEQIIADAESIGLLPEKQFAFGYVIGVIFGDGSISKETNRIPHTCKDGTIRYHDSTIYLVRLQVTSEAFANRFASQWETLANRPAKLWTTTRTNFSKSTLKGFSGEYNVQLFNFRRCHVLLGRYFKHLKHDSELYELLRFPPEVMRGIIYGMIDSEGYVKDRYIEITNKRTTLLDVLALMLNLLGYKATVRIRPDKSMSRLITRMNYSKFGL